MNADDVKKAQGLVGELLWLSVRTRPDISFGVAWMAQHITKCPQLVVKAAEEMVGYLLGTQSLGLSYERCVGGRGVDGALPFAHAMNRIELYADVSYAPGGGRSHQGVMACYGGSLVQWLSVRQAFTTLSTAEAELVGYLEAMTMGQSVAVVLGILEKGAWDDLLVDVAKQQDLVYSDLVQHGERLYEGEVQDVDAPLEEEHEKNRLLAENHEGAGVHRGDDRKGAQVGQDSSVGGGGDFVVYGDNSSAITIIGSADGPWRTRHLRLRAEVLREKVKGGRWAVRHLPGTRLVADHLTKAMTAKAQWPKFYELAGMVKVDVEKVESSSTEWRSTENVNKLKLAGLGLIMGKVASWTPENGQEKEVKTLCLAALGVGVAYVATLITRGHRLKKITKEGRRSPRDNEPGAGKCPGSLNRTPQRGKGLGSLNQAPRWRAQGTMNLGSRTRRLGNMNQAQGGSSFWGWVKGLGIR